MESGELVSLYPYFRPPQPDNGVFAIYPKREYLPVKVRVFMEFLTRILADMVEGSTYTWAEKWEPLIGFGGQGLFEKYATKNFTLKTLGE